LLAVSIGSLMLLAACGPAWSQAPAGPLQQKPGASPEKMPTAEQQKHAIRVRVNEVIAPVTVTNHSGEMILDLSKDNFRVYDNGVQQKIEHFDLGGDPLSIVLAIETSSHIEPCFQRCARLESSSLKRDGTNGRSGGESVSTAP